MSLDYPLYEEMRRRKSLGAPIWLLGDRMYYLGLFIVIFSVLGGIAIAQFPRLEEWYAGVGLVTGIVCFGVGVRLKSKSYTLAERDGINVQDY